MDPIPSLTQFGVATMSLQSYVTYGLRHEVERYFQVRNLMCRHPYMTQCI